MGIEKEFDEVAERVIAESQREYVAFAKIVLSKISEDIKLQIGGEFSTEEMENYAGCKTHWYGPTKRQLKRFIREDLKYMLEDGWVTCRVALAVGNIGLALSLIMRGHSDWKDGKKINAVALLNKEGLAFTCDPRPNPSGLVPKNYFVYKISERAGLSQKAAEAVWEGIIEALIGGSAYLSKFGISAKYNPEFGEAIELRMFDLE